MFGVGPLELVMMVFMVLVQLGIPIATLVLVFLIYRNTRKPPNANQSGPPVSN